MPATAVEALARVPLFADLNKREIEQIARLFKERRFSAGETVAKEGAGGAVVLRDRQPEKPTVSTEAETDARRSDRATTSARSR